MLHHVKDIHRSRHELQKQLFIGAKELYYTLWCMFFFCVSVPPVSKPEIQNCVISDAVMKFVAWKVKKPIRENLTEDASSEKGRFQLFQVFLVVQLLFTRTN